MTRSLAWLMLAGAFLLAVFVLLSLVDLWSS